MQDNSNQKRRFPHGIDVLAAFNRLLATQNEMPEDEQQISFGFSRPPKVLFVKNIETGEYCKRYKDLSAYCFTEAEQERIDQARQEIQADGGYDGDQLLLTRMRYNAVRNVLFLEVKRAKYSFIRTLQKNEAQGGFLPTSKFYQQPFFTMGVRAPFLTPDGFTFFMKRALRPRVYSVAAGHMELKKQADLNQWNQVTHTAVQETIEEFLPPSAIRQLHGIMAVAMRRNGQCIEVEFIAPIGVRHRKQALAKLLENNTANDAREHVNGDYVAIPMETSDRQEAIACLQAMPQEGAYVRPPIVESVARLLCQLRIKSSIFNRAIPGSSTAFVPISHLITKAPRTLPCKADIEEDTDQKISMSHG